MDKALASSTLRGIIINDLSDQDHGVLAVCAGSYQALPGGPQPAGDDENIKAQGGGGGGGGGGTLHKHQYSPATGVKVRSSGQGEILKLVKQSS